MQVSLDALKTALRVLQAYCDRRDPDPRDAAQLRGFAPLLSNEPLDEVARTVIHQATKRFQERLHESRQQGSQAPDPTRK